MNAPVSRCGCEAEFPAPGNVCLGEKLRDKLMDWPRKTARCGVSGVVFHFAWGLGSAGTDY